jgi:hypothetical protein
LLGYNLTTTLSSNMAGMFARLLGPMLIGPALKAVGIGGVVPRAPTGRAQASAGKRRKRPAAVAGKRKVSAKTLAALAKGRATAKRNRQKRR